MRLSSKCCATPSSKTVLLTAGQAGVLLTELRRIVVGSGLGRWPGRRWPATIRCTDDKTDPESISMMRKISFFTFRFFVFFLLDRWPLSGKILATTKLRCCYSVVSLSVLPGGETKEYKRPPRYPFYRYFECDEWWRRCRNAFDQRRR